VEDDMIVTKVKDVDVLKLAAHRDLVTLLGCHLVTTMLGSIMVLDSLKPNYFQQSFEFY